MASISQGTVNVYSYPKGALQKTTFKRFINSLVGRRQSTGPVLERYPSIRGRAAERGAPQTRPGAASNLPNCVPAGQ